LYICTNFEITRAIYTVISTSGRDLVQKPCKISPAGRDDGSWSR
jgi:hypothetical protein